VISNVLGFKLPEQDADPGCEVQAEHHRTHSAYPDSFKPVLGSRYSVPAPR